MCAACEVEWRQKVQDKHPIGKKELEWATLAIVMKDLKKANKGEHKITKGIHYQAACCIVQDEPNYQKL